MSLTDDWKNGNLSGNYFYVRTLTGNILIDNIDYDRPHYDGFYHEVSEIIAPVPNYDHFVELTKKAEKFEKAFIKALQNNDELSAVITGNELEIDHLRQLLKECYVEIGEYMDSDNRLIQILRGMFENDKKID